MNPAASEAADVQGDDADLAQAWQEVQAEAAPGEDRQGGEGGQDPELDSDDEDVPVLPTRTFTLKDFVANSQKSLDEQLQPFTTPNCKFDLEEERYKKRTGWVLDTEHHIDYVLFKGAPNANITASVGSGGNVLGGFKLNLLRSRDRLKHKAGTFDFDIRGRTYALGEFDSIGKVTLIACPFARDQGVPDALEQDGFTKSDTCMSIRATTHLNEFILDILHSRVGNEDGASNPFANTGLHRDAAGNPIIPPNSPGGIQLNQPQLHELLDRIINNWEFLNARSGHAFASTQPMFVCQKYGQDIPIRLRPATETASLVKSMAGAFNFQSLDSVSFAIAHNVFHMGDKALLSCHSAVLNLFEPHQQKLVHSYKIAGQPDLGNFATTACPMFMTKALVKANADLVTTFGVRGPSPLSISHFQGYSGAKSLFRNTPRDYIFKSGIWSIGLAISRPVLSKDVKAHVDARSVARDTQGIRNKHRLQLLAVESSAYKHFRFEYILNMRLDGFIDHDKNASTVTNFGIVPLAVAFMEALTDWKKTLCRVPSNVFPFALVAVLRPLFNLLEHLVSQSINSAGDKFDVQVAEVVAMIERAISYIMTGDLRLFPGPPSKRFGTLENIRRCGLPYWNPALVDLVAGKVKITEWAQNPDRSPFFSNIATIKFNYGDETAKRLELSYALELSILRKTAFGATLKIGTMMTRIAKEFLADQIRSTFDNVHASFVAEQRALTRADLALNGEMPGHEHIVATQDLEDRVNHLLAWNRLPDDDKFTVDGSQSLAYALGHEVLPRTSRTKVTTFDRAASTMVSLALAVVKQEKVRVSASVKWLQATPEEGEQPGVSTFNLAVKATSPWVLCLATIITHLQASRNHREPDSNALKPALATALLQQGLEYLPSCDNKPGHGLRPSYTSYTGVVTNDNYATSATLSDSLFVPAAPHPAAPTILSGGTVDMVQFSLPFEGREPAPYTLSKAIFRAGLTGANAQYRASWDKIWDTVNLQNPVHCLYIATAMIWCLRRHPYRWNPITLRWEDPSDNSKKRVGLYIAFFVGACIVHHERALLLPSPISEGPLFINMANGKNSGIPCNHETLSRLRLGEAVGAGKSKFKTEDGAWVVRDTKKLENRWKKLCGLWQEKRYPEVLHKVGFLQAEAEEICRSSGL